MRPQYEPKPQRKRNVLGMRSECDRNPKNIEKRVFSECSRNEMGTQTVIGNECDDGHNEKEKEFGTETEGR